MTSISGSSISSLLYSSVSNNSAKGSDLFKKADADNDGKLSLSEFEALSAGTSANTNSINQLIAANDSDGDGALNADELKGAVSQFLSKLQAGGFLSGANLVQAQGSGAPPAPPSAQDFVTKADTDGDGAISLDEFKAAAPKGADASKVQDAFSKMDTDGDGKLSVAELQAAQDAHKTATAGQAHHGHHMHGGGKAGGSDDDDDSDTTTASTDPLDTNGDGIVSADEMMAGLDKIKSAMGQFFLQQQEQQSAFAA